MGAHDTWYTLLPFWSDLEHALEAGLRRDWKFLMFQATHFTLVHVMGALIAAVLVIIAAMKYKASLNDETKGIVPSRKWTLGAMIDGFVGAVYRLSCDVMGEENSKRYLHITATFGLFIFCGNIQGLIPGLLPPTDSLKTNLALSLIVFVTYFTLGVVRNPTHFLGEFLGPKIGKYPVLAPLFFPVEVASHLARPVSLALRLTGNIMADHKVVLAITGLIAVVAPVPFLLLGVLVSIIQTLIFTLLSIIFIGLAVEHADAH